MYRINYCNIKQKYFDRIILNGYEMNSEKQWYR